MRADGCEQIVGFHMVGDFIGVEALSTGMHTCDVLALEDCELCSISSKKDLDVSLTDNMLTIKGKVSREEKQEQANY